MGSNCMDVSVCGGDRCANSLAAVGFSYGFGTAGRLLAGYGPYVAGVLYAVFLALRAPKAMKSEDLGTLTSSDGDT